MQMVLVSVSQNSPASNALSPLIMQTCSFLWKRNPRGDVIIQDDRTGELFTEEHFIRHEFAPPQARPASLAVMNMPRVRRKIVEAYKKGVLNFLSGTQ
jgi:hypothetical protein